MTQSQTALSLSRRAVACRGWRWMPRMLDDDGCTVCFASDDGYLLLAGSEDSVVGWWPVAERLPDLTDAATLGCLLALVREAWGDPFLCPAADRETGWWLNGYAAVDYLQSYRSEAEALVAALESAP